jgi:hypothetical protein
MKVTNESIMNVVCSRDFCEYQIYSTKRIYGHVTENSVVQTILEKSEYYKQSGFRRMVFSKKSVENLKNYSIPKSIRLDVLRSLPNRKDVIQLDDSTCIKYIKTNEKLTVSTHFSDRTNPSDVCTHTYWFSVNLNEGHLLCDRSNTMTGMMINKLSDVVEHYYSKFLIVVTYLELTNVELTIVDGVMNKHRKTYSGLSNTSRFNVVHVNSNWNQLYINLNGVNVKGHWRLQPCGVGRTQYKYVWINPYEKGIMKRLPQKELVC